MSKRKDANLIAQIAKQFKISEKEVRDQIQASIDLAMENSDPTVQAFWAGVPCRGKKPTPEEVIVYLVNGIKSNNKI